MTIEEMRKGTPTLARRDGIFVKDGKVFICMRAKNGVWRAFQKDFLIADMFVPNPNNWTGIRHKDGNPHNCAADNLEWYPETSTN